jgi:adenylyltransferase/sulfurtransferase
MPNQDRYSRQIRFPAIGESGQRALAEGAALVIGCGALGSVIINTLARAGVGRLRIVDRDFLELSNLQRQMLYDEADVAKNLPKAIAASEKLKGINSSVQVEPLVTDVDATNIGQLCDGVDVILDGTDNFETRFLINDAAIKFGIPWIYGGCLGADGQTMTVIPGTTSCLRCLMIDGPPLPGTTPTCDSAGVLAPAINVIGSIQACEALKILSGNAAAVSNKLSVVELWTNQVRQMDLSTLRDQVDCPACKGEEFEWLDGERGSHSAVLCGRNAVQLSPPERQPVDLDQLEEGLAGVARVERNRFLLRLFVDDFVVTVFRDGRAIIGGTEEIAVARKLYAQYVGG